MKRARLLAFVLTAAMATSVFLGGTVAKYQTSATIGDEATVAKWGVKLTMAGNLYDEKYKTGLVGESTPVVTGDYSVSSSESADRVAPGTTGDKLRISLTGKTEVDTLLTLNIPKSDDIYLAEGKTFAIMQRVTGLSHTEYVDMVKKGQLYLKTGNSFAIIENSVANKELATFNTNVGSLYIMQNNVTIGAGGYYPVKYVLKNESTTLNAGATKAADVKEKINLIFTTNTPYITDGVVKANTDMTNLGMNNMTLTWSWDIGSDDITHNADTILGALSNGNVEDQTYVVMQNGVNYDVLLVTDGVVQHTSGPVGSVKTSFSITITVSQKD